MPEESFELAEELLALCLPGRGLEGLPNAAGLGENASETGASRHNEAHWEVLISQAIQQGIAPLVAIRSRGLAIPTPVRERLESLYRANGMRNLRLAAEEARICAALSAASVPHWPLKGPGLSERLYGDIGVRQVSDLDLLIEPAYLARTDALLEEMGFRRQTAGKIDSLAAAQELIYIRDRSDYATGATASDLSSRRRENGGGNRVSPGDAPSGKHPATYLDLHQRLLPYVRRDALAARVFREGMTAENLLLYLCANQITHRFARLRYVCDVSAFLDGESPSLDWDRFLASARAMPWGPGIGLGLRWASQFSRHPAPQTVLHRLRPNAIGGALLRRALGASAAEAASRARILDSSAGAMVPLGAAFLGRPSAYGIAWNLLVPSRAYLREQTGVAAGQPLASAYATRLLQKIPGALRQFFQPQR
jgi:Uncharacterised nucleotidyltransferase